MSRYQFTDPEGVRWATGYDPPAGAYFLDSNVDREDMVEHAEDHPTAKWSEFAQLAKPLVEIPANIRIRLRAQEPDKPDPAISAAFARIDQIRDSQRSATVSQSQDRPYDVGRPAASIRLP